MIAIITEKPSVAQDIAKVLDVTEKKNGYYQGSGYKITWAFGHLIGLALPSDYGFERPAASDLPIIPESFSLIIRRKKSERGYVTDPGVAKQIKIIESVFNDCESIIVATDAGREGELIFRYIYNYIGCKKPFKRLWISSMTDKAIRDGFKNLHNGNEYDNLYKAADCRAKADWLIGINASQALCISSGIWNNSLGRVQTPTLGMICARFLENRSHQTAHYWQHHITLSKDGLCSTFTAVENIYNKEEAEKIYDTLKSCSSANILKVEKKVINQSPPLLYDLTSLQKDANNHLNLTADQTLSLTQGLYEKKLVSYPRTGSCYIPEDVFAEIGSLLRFILRMRSFSHCEELIDSKELNKRSVDNSKITDHHALIITGIRPENLSAQEQSIYNLIAGRMMEAFSPRCEKEAFTCHASCNNMEFKLKSSRILSPGWRSVFKREDDKEEGENIAESGFPEFIENEVIPVSGYSLVQKKTLPRPLFNEATLLTAMENAGRNLTDETQREALKDCGIGTPATRASIIETLIKRSYIERAGKAIVPTEKGMYIYHAVKEMRIADVSLTGEWEKSLTQIESGNFSPQTFMDAINVHTEQVTREILSIRINNGGKISCPKCGTGKIMILNKVAKCDNEECRLVVYRQVLNKVLTEQHLEQLFSKGSTKLIKGFKGQKEKSFDASVVFDRDFSTKLDFPKRTQTKKKH